MKVRGLPPLSCGGKHQKMLGTNAYSAFLGSFNSLGLNSDKQMSTSNIHDLHNFYANTYREQQNLCYA